ncbi:MAG: alginate export family protein [Proteobacteria bacterium]|nr:alginate export family protein [Pseudomonadota bacterium]
MTRLWLALTSLLLLVASPAMAGETTDEPAAETDDKPAAETDDEPAAETDDEPAAETDDEPAAETVDEPVDAPADPPADGPAEATKAPEVAAHEGPKLTFAVSAQERARFDYKPDFDFDGDASGTWSIGNRARVGLRVSYGAVGAFIQIQDVRRWGSEYNPATLGEGTLFDWAADGLDVHQAYGEVNARCNVVLRIGRQEINWHGQRLIGAVGWTHQARSFDAARLVYSGEKAGAEVLYALLLDRPTSGATDTSPRGDDQHLLGLRGGPRFGDPLALDGLAIIRFDKANQETLATFGGHAKGKVGIFGYEVEGYGQAGERTGVDIAAFLIGVRAGVTIPEAAKLHLGGGVDIVSGDADPADGVIRTFDTLYATNHKFYGHIDRYLALPVHTGSQGLIDGIVNIGLAPHPKVGFKADLHVFAAANPLDGVDPFHGVEIDLNTHWKPFKPFKVAAGVWTYIPGAFHGEDLKGEVGGYLMTDFNFK